MAVSSMADSGMSEDCMKMMAQQPQPAQKPCKGMTLACIAAMGCVIPMAVRNDAPGLAAREAGQTLAFWPTSTVLRGSDLTPVPEPPTLLGCSEPAVSLTGLVSLRIRTTSPTCVYHDVLPKDYSHANTCFLCHSRCSQCLGEGRCGGCGSRGPSLVILGADGDCSGRQ